MQIGNKKAETWHTVIIFLAFYCPYFIRNSLFTLQTLLTDNLVIHFLPHSRQFIIIILCWTYWPCIWPLWWLESQRRPSSWSARKMSRGIALFTWSFWIFLLIFRSHRWSSISIVSLSKISQCRIDGRTWKTTKSLFNGRC